MWNFSEEQIAKAKEIEESEDFLAWAGANLTEEEKNVRNRKRGKFFFVWYTGTNLNPREYGGDWNLNAFTMGVKKPLTETVTS